MRTIHFS